MNKKIVSSIVAILVGMTLFAGCKKEDDTLIVATEAGFAPYEYMEGDKVVGIDMDIAQAIADSMGKKLVIKNMDFDGALLAVQQGKVDFAAAGISITPDRAEQMDFSLEYDESEEVIVVNKDNPAVTEVSNEGLAGKIIGVQQGNVADIYIDDEENNIGYKELKRYTLFSQAAEDLKNNKIDCIVMDKFPAEFLVDSNPELSILDGILFTDKYAIAVKKGNKELLDQINTVLQELIDSGKIDEFTKNHSLK